MKILVNNKANQIKVSIIHPVSVPRCRLLDSPGKISNFEKSSGVRPSSKFFTRDIIKPTGDNMKNLRGEPHKHTILNEKTYTYILIYIYIYIYIYICIYT